MDAYDRFHQTLKRKFWPVLRADGFRGSGSTFRRLKGDRIDILNVQGSRFGGRCCVNIAVHFSFLPCTGGGRITDPKKMTEYECAFRERLHEPSETDHWWTYGGNDAELEASVAHLLDNYQRRSAAFFRRFEPFPDSFEQITSLQLDSGDLSKMPGRFTVVWAALTMARIMDHLGQRAKCRDFAEVGLRHLGPAIALKAELEQLRDGDQGPLQVIG